MTTKVTDSYRRHYAHSSSADADQAEFLALKNGATAVDAGMYDDRLAGTLDDPEAGENRERWHREDLGSDTVGGRTQAEIERRAALLGPAYPFTLDQGMLAYAERPVRVYEFFLCICNTQLTQGEHVWFPRVFERVAARLVATYFGAYAQSVHIGSPRDEAVGRSFHEAMATVARRTGEWTWGPDEGLPTDYRRGDEGCDFVVCLDAADGRQIGQLFVLGQCACGNDWDTKLRDLDLARFRKWFNPLSVVEPVRSFATPHHVADVGLREASRESGVFFDRARLTSIASAAREGVLGGGIEQRMRELVELVLR